MLSLKHSNFIRPSSSKRLDNLPGEILDQVIEHVYRSGGCQVGSVIPASLTCRQLRLSSVAIIFEHLHILANNVGVRSRSHKFLQHFVSNPHLLRHVRILHVLTPLAEDGRWPDDLEFHYHSSESLLKQAVAAMTGLRRVRLDHLSGLTIILLKMITPNPNIRVTLDFHLTRADAPTWACIEDCRSMSTTCNSPMDISFPAPSFHYARKAIFELFLNASNVSALNCYQASHFLAYLIDARKTINSIDELYISTLSEGILTRFASSSFIPWGTLKKLQIEGNRQIKHLMEDVMEQLHNLTHLRLRPRQTTFFHSQCPTSELSQLDCDRTKFTRLPNLRHLELFNICNHIPVEQFAMPHLRSLRIQLPEYAARLSGLDSARSPAQIRWLAKHVPNLERLEIHVGDLENLWHPTAIPGVDVDVEVYQVLHLLASFSNLRQLRLFPPYVPKTARHNFHSVKQPLSDEQAVRVYRHVKALCKSLQSLSIAATFEQLWTFSPMSWTLWSHCDKTVLITRQAGKDYEIEQIWVGERRISMSNRRHAHNKPYLPELNNWTYSVTTSSQQLHLPWTMDETENNDFLP